jgi:hypothetical protein
MHLTTIFEFVYKFILNMILGCALGYRSWIDTLVALSQLSDLSLRALARDRLLAMVRCRCRLW